MNKQKRILLVLIGIVLLINIIFIWKIVENKSDSEKEEQSIEHQQDRDENGEFVDVIEETLEEEDMNPTTSEKETGDNKTNDNKSHKDENSNGSSASDGDSNGNTNEGSASDNNNDSSSSGEELELPADPVG